jgi:deoxyribodipyrimidine photo-lyase
MSKQKINIVWLKRDLRFTDHVPLFNAHKSGLPILLIYIFEPSIMAYDDSDIRHWRFVHESLLEMNVKLNAFDARIHIFHHEANVVFKSLSNLFQIHTVFSSVETGNKLTFDRDKLIASYFNEKQIGWNEYQTNGVIRRLSSRKDWQKLWKLKMSEQPCNVKLEELKLISIPIDSFLPIKGTDLHNDITKRNPNFQPGGESFAWKYLQNFISERHVDYSKNISSPSLSRKSCSRLSPYLAYGNISMRMVYQYTSKHYAVSSNKRALSNFISRLHWHCHFIQKFETECRYEFENINRGYDAIVKPKNEEYIKAWQTGQTGIPIIDACMRCLVETGYLNFRMRAMVVSFFAYNLWQDWRELHFLARQFLDYEPGIHYPQLQMQCGTTGINTIRIYNPIKNAASYDKEGLFVKKWVPELINIPSNLIHEPHKLTSIEQKLYDCEIGKDYPFPIVDVEQTRKIASEIMWANRKTTKVKDEAKRVLKMHVNTSN